ncbi:pentatricopeptide repeat (PPR) superfamily protein [Artemisia annua]|uniref:Pentatricopeptide repeat (PPR) superfamily protein n=1 Tax=Artemisia annua TaxID=35608 RepID=A0A2U1NQ33_ARTAN|nr:pentatricopeptide repeat (PPR) superfamily protein [Artemisia annua]
MVKNDVLERGLECDVFIGAGLVDLYCKCGRLGDARNVFDKMWDKDVAVWNAMVAGLSQSLEFGEAVEVFRSMWMCGGVEVNSVSLLNLFPAICKLSSVGLCKCVHGYVIRRLFPNSVVNGLIDVYSKCGRPDLAYRVFELMHEPDDVSWGTLMAGLALNGCHNEVLELFDQMMNYRLNVNIVSVVSALSAAGETKDLKKGKMIHECVKKNKFDSDIRVSTPLITMYAKCGELEKALDLFHKLSGKDMVACKDHVLWNVMISAYTRHGRSQESISTFHQMKSNGFSPGLVTFVSVLPAVAYLAAIKEGTSLHGEIIRMGFLSHNTVCNTLIDMYSKCGRLDYAELVFNEINDKDNVSWNVMLAGYALNGLGDCAFDFFTLMQENLVEIDPVSFVSVLSACRHAGLVNEGKRVFALMKEKHNIEPKLEHYACMVDLLGRAGLFDETLQLIESMPMEPDAGVWGGLLGACQMHSNVKVAELALDNLVKLEPGNQAHYVVLSSIYAESGRWADAKSLRMKMSESGVKKTPGRSWVNENRDLPVLEG